MNLELHNRKQTIWVFVDGKHRKTVATKYAEAIVKEADKINFTKKYLSEAETLILDLYLSKSVIKDFLQKLKQKEKRVFDLVATAKVTGVRFVNSKAGDRHELCFDNNLKVKIPRRLYNAYPVKFDQVFLNY